MRQPLEKRHLQRRTLLRRHLLHSCPRSFHDLLARSFLGQRRVERDDYLLQIALRPPLAQHIDRPMPRDHRQPRSQAAAVGVKGAGIPPELQKHVLQNVFRQRCLAQHPQRHRIDDAGIAFIQCVHRRLIAGAQTGDQLRVVGHLFGTGLHSPAISFLRYDFGCSLDWLFWR